MYFCNSEPSSEQQKYIEALVVELLTSNNEVVSVVVLDSYGHLIASSRMPDDEMNTFSKSAFELFAQSDAVARQMSHDKLEQIVALTNEGYSVIASGFGTGIIASLSRAGETKAALEHQ